MKLSGAIAAVAAVGLCAPAFAGGTQSVGTLTAATQGTFVSRDGKLIPAVSGQALYAGDRVVTRGSANAKASFAAGCSYTIAPTSMLSVAPSACASHSASFAKKTAAQEGAEGAGSGAGTGGGSGYLIAALAVAAAAGGVVAATSNSDTKAVSP